MDTGHIAPANIMDPTGAGFSSGVNNIFQQYLGPPKSIQEADPFEKRPFTTYNMPEAYKGKTRFMRDFIEDAGWTYHQRFYTEILLPWQETDDLTHEWSSWEANAHLMASNPHQAPSRIISQRRTVRRAQLQRIGLSMEFEHDFMRTAIGRRSFGIGIFQIARSWQETGNHMVIRSLLDAHRYQQYYVRETGQVRKRDYLQVLSDDKYRRLPFFVISLR